MQQHNPGDGDMIVTLVLRVTVVGIDTSARFKGVVSTWDLTKR